MSELTDKVKECSDATHPIKIPPQRIRIPTADRKKIHCEIEKLFNTGMFAYGHNVKLFEQQFAKFCGRKYAVAMNSCTTALEVAFRSIYPNNRITVAVPTNTYMASANAVINAGHTVKLVDCDDDMNMSVDDLKKVIDQVQAVLLVHIGGNISERSLEIRELCESRGMPLYEDAAHAHGSTHPYDTNLKAGNIGHISCFSFYPTKMMTVGGEGGMMLTDERRIAELARFYRHHGRMNPKKDKFNYTHIQAGSNFCMDEIRAIIGLTQLKRLPEFIANRHEIAKIYIKKFPSLTTVRFAGNCYKFIIMDKIKVLSPDVSLSGPVYRVPLHLQPYLFEGPGKYPKAEDLCFRHNCLPIYNDMTVEEAKFVVDNIQVE